MQKNFFLGPSNEKVKACKKDVYPLRKSTRGCAKGNTKSVSNIFEQKIQMQLHESKKELILKAQSMISTRIEVTRHERKDINIGQLGKPV